MKFFKKKYQYILPMLCVAAFSAQATDLTEQELLAITGQAALTQKELFDILNLQGEQEELVNDRALRNKQNEDFKEMRFQDLENDSVLSDLNKKLMHNESILKDSKARLEQFPGNPIFLGTIETCQKTIEDVQAQINLYTVSLMKDYEKDCESYGIDSTLSSTVQTMKNISEKTNESSSENSNESRGIQKFKKFIELPEEIQLLIVTENCKQSLSEDQYPSDIGLVNKKWNDWMTNEKSLLCQFLKEVELKVEIFHEDLADIEAKKINKLKNNKWATFITLHFDFNDRLNPHYDNHLKVIEEGMQNKPKLKKIKILGDFSISAWLTTDKTNYRREPVDPKIFFDFPHLKWLPNIEELIIEGELLNVYYLKTYFIEKMVPLMTNLRLLKAKNCDFQK